jgi:hypothetical protein
MYAAGMRRAASLLVGLSLLAGCASEPALERTRSEREAIVNGEPDTTHQAVVAVFGSSNVCSGTIIAVSDDHGFALTSAACMTDPPTAVILGADYAAPQWFLTVSDFVIHPDYDPGGGYDFAIVQFMRAGIALPVIQPLAPHEDQLQVGSTLELVGYGETAPGTGNSVRRRALVQLAQVGPLAMETAEGGGPCTGDEGGPGLVDVISGERVASVTSFFSAACTYANVGRVSAIKSTFIDPYLAGGGAAGAAGAGGTAGTGGSALGGAAGAGFAGGAGSGAAGGLAGTAGVGDAGVLPAGSDDGGGCGCRTRPARGHGGAPLAILFALAAGLWASGASRRKRHPSG